MRILRLCFFHPKLIIFRVLWVVSALVDDPRCRIHIESIRRSECYLSWGFCPVIGRQRHGEIYRFQFAIFYDDSSTQLQSLFGKLSKSFPRHISYQRLIFVYLQIPFCHKISIRHQYFLEALRASNQYWALWWHWLFFILIPDLRCWLDQNSINCLAEWNEWKLPKT